MRQSRLPFALAVALLGASAIVTMLPDSAQAQPNTGVDGWNVTEVFHPGGSVVQTGQDAWTEYDYAGRPIFYFTQITRDQWSVYLIDASRDMQMQLDLWRRKISAGSGGSPRTDMYDITESIAGRVQNSFAGRRNSAAGQPNSAGGQRFPAGTRRAVNAGPIWNQQDAEVKCPVAAFATGGRWTGAWYTTVSGQMSVCEMDF